MDFLKNFNEEEYSLLNKYIFSIIFDVFELDINEKPHSILDKLEKKVLELKKTKISLENYDSRIINIKKQYDSEIEFLQKRIASHEKEKENNYDLIKQNYELIISNLQKDFEHKIQIISQNNPEIINLKSDIKKSDEQIKNLLHENDILNKEIVRLLKDSKNINDVISHIESTKGDLKNEVNKISTSLSINTVKGTFGENLIQKILEDSFPLADIYSIAREKTVSDIFMNLNGVNFQIESKSYSEKSANSNHKRIIEDFLKRTREASTESNIDVSILVNVENNRFGNKTNFLIEEECVNGHSIVIMYIYGIIENHNRLVMAVNLALKYLELLKINKSKDNVTTQLNAIKDLFLNFEKNFKVRESNIKSEINALDEDKKTYNSIDNIFSIIFGVNTSNDPKIINQNKVIDIYKKLKNDNKNLSKNIFIQECIKNGIQKKDILSFKDIENILKTN